MHLVIFIPAYNEEQTLPIAFNALPKKISGVERISTLVVNDGSTDKTVDVAKSLKATKIVSFKSNQGLAKVFQAGLAQAVTMGADITVMFDADNQYSANSIPQLIQPILTEKADIVVGARPIKNIAHFSTLKKLLQKTGSLVVRKVSGLDIPDAPSGFRAYSHEAALKLVVVSDFTYTLETLIQAKNKGLTVRHVPIKVNKEQLRKSRLFKNNFQYIKRSIDTIFRIYFMYNAFKVLRRLGVLAFVIATIISIRFLYFFFAATSGQYVGHIQSLILAAILFIIGSFLIIFSFMADMIQNNRKYIEEILYNQRKNQ